MMPPQPAPVIQRLADGDPVKPGLQRTAPAESADAAKRLEKNVLRDIGGVTGFRDHPGNEAVHRTRIVRHQPVERCVGATLQLRHKLGFVLRPGKDARQVRHVCHLSCLHAPSVLARTRAKRHVPYATDLKAAYWVSRPETCSAEKHRLASASIELDTIKGEWFPPLSSIVRLEYLVCNGTG